MMEPPVESVVNRSVPEVGWVNLTRLPVAWGKRLNGESRNIPVVVKDYVGVELSVELGTLPLPDTHNHYPFRSLRPYKVVGW